MPLTVISLLEYLRPDVSPSVVPVQALTCPVPPSSLTVGSGKRVDTLQLVDIGEVDFFQGARVQEVRFTALFPSVYDPAYCVISLLPDPTKAGALLERWAAQNVPIRLVVSAPKINLMCRLSEVEITHKGGEPGDVYAELTLRAWTVVKPRPASSGAAKGPSRPDTRPAPNIYTVVPGDTLQTISWLLWATAGHADVVYQYNRLIIGPDPTALRPGMQLLIPSI